ncbi:MAG TPA: hypothetical protein VMN39_08760, partial [Longimicrobiaceae bacterium]|nr:hypothetical protein [Longimicrobiaceae bacterium]
MERIMVTAAPGGGPGLASKGGSGNTRVGFAPFLGLALQLALVLAIAWTYRVEFERGMGILAPLILGGFAIHAWLPVRARLPFFLLLGATAAGLLLGPDGLWLGGLGLALIGLCHVPVAWWARALAVAAAGAALAALRTGWIEAPWATTVIPILAAMFMFRLILYLYDLKHEKTPASPWQRTAYFFLLPNVCFPLFPVVDFKAFIRGYYDAPAGEIYQKGVYWMLRGVGHLLLYRIVYHLLPMADSDVSVVGVFAFMAMTYGLYLRVSGLFHLIVGILCLFGFDLPPTNNRYFLASSFSDLWRRINIYWKDFMMTVVFYPVFLGIRRGRIEHRIIVATALVFVVTWALHSYQWFWLQGVFPVTGRDIVFWGFLGVALAINSAWEAKRGRDRRIEPRPGSWSWRAALGTTARTVGVFSVMSILWSLWNSESLLEWGYRVLRIQESALRDWILLAVVVAAALGLGVAGSWIDSRGRGLARIESLAWRNARFAVPCVAIGLLLLGAPSIHQRLGAPANRVVAKAQSTALNTLDANRQERGYYEALSRSNQLGPGAAGIDEDFGNFRLSPAVRQTGDIRWYELVPDADVSVMGKRFRTNSLGLHDRDYAKAKAPGVHRIALLGSSYVMGWGVESAETFENLVEDRLNLEREGSGQPRHEILNFAVSGYNVLQALHVAEHGVAEYEPDVVMYVVHNNERNRLLERLQLSLKQGVRLDESYAPVRGAVEETGAHAYLPSNEF